MKIQLYPSLQFGWDIAQFQAVAKEYLKLDEEQEEQDNSEDETDKIDPEEYEEEEL